MSLTRCVNGHMFSSRRYGSICPYCNIAVQMQNGVNAAGGNEADFDSDSPYLGEIEVIDPVTGWLVCIKGPQMGRDYRIMAEKNFVGRAEDMHIQILGDNSISRRNHATLVYDPKARSTLILPGDASGLAYLNNQAVYTPTELNPYDVIQLGMSEFLFIPLCGDNFEWEGMKGKGAGTGQNNDQTDEIWY